MDKHDFFKCIEIHKRLKDRIKGKIFIGINDKTMTVSIGGFRNIRYTTYYTDLPDYFNYNDFTNKILEDYKTFLLSKFFIQEVL